MLGKQIRSNATKSRERHEGCEIADDLNYIARKKKIKLRDQPNVDKQQRTLTPKAYMPSFAGIPGKPREILELFMKDQVFEVLTNYTNLDSTQHGNHKFALDVRVMKVFEAILCCLDIAVFRNKEYI